MRKIKNPTPDDIKIARKYAGLTQTEAGALVHAGLRAWQGWEHGDHKMPPASWELFLIKANIPDKHLIKTRE